MVNMPTADEIMQLFESRGFQRGIDREGALGFYAAGFEPNSEAAAFANITRRDHKGGFYVRYVYGKLDGYVHTNTTILQAEFDEYGEPVNNDARRVLNVLL